MADLDLREEVLAPADEPAAPPPKKKRRRRTLWLVIGIFAAFVVYAYAFETTEVSLDRIRDETRQEQLARVLRALAQPDLVEYQTVDTAVDLEYMVPCPTTGTFVPASIEGGLQISVDTPCADPRAQVTISGSGYIPNRQVSLFFVPPNGTQLRLAVLRTDDAGRFEELVRLPNRPDEAVQTIRAVSAERIGSIFSPVMAENEDGDLVRSPRWSQNAIDTLDKIIETVFLALLATTAGTLIAIPLSFFAAKNLMRDVRIPAIQLGLAISGIPVGVGVGLLAFNGTRELVDMLPDSAWIHITATIVLGWVAVRLIRIAVPATDSSTGRFPRIVAGLGFVAALMIAGQSLATFMTLSGQWISSNAPSIDFIGNFVSTNGDILSTIFGVLSALAGAGVIGLIGSKLGYAISKRVPVSLHALLTIGAMALAAAIVAIGVGQVVKWLYQIENPQTTLIIPGVVGAVIGAFFAWRGLRKGQLGAGIGIYYISRTVFNTMRSIEPLVMAIVFVIWVGLGPFAGSLALGLHTVAALTKLYSEQVESINEGPVEAVRATGATRLQTVVYGVVPQIVAPYISFTMYRWDINVRMSTIIGFVGGGGIGFLLQQNIRLLNYRGAAAQMLAIAVVVASMDYISSRLRERYT